MVGSLLWNDGKIRGQMWRIHRRGQVLLSPLVVGDGIKGQRFIPATFIEFTHL